MDINFNWDLYDFGTEKIKFRLKVAYECFNHNTGRILGPMVLSYIIYNIYNIYNTKSIILGRFLYESYSI